MIDLSRVVILSMFCNKDLYVKEKIAVEQTWGQDAVKAGFKHIFYTETDKNTRLSGNVLYISCPGSRVKTYKKTSNALKYIEDNFDYDYIIKTNVSTYVNIQILIQALEYLMKNNNNDDIYGSRIILDGKNLYIRGDFTIINRQTCRDMLKVYMQTKKRFPNGPDDALMFYMLNEQYGIAFANRLKTITAVTTAEYNYETVCNACAIRLKTLKSDGYQIIDRMYTFHQSVKNEIKKFQFTPQLIPMYIFVRELGDIQYDKGINMYHEQHKTIEVNKHIKVSKHLDKHKEIPIFPL